MHNKTRAKIVLSLCSLLIAVGDTWARTYPVNPQFPDVVGELSSASDHHRDTVLSKPDETLASVSRRLRIGVDALTAANPQLITDVSTTLKTGTTLNLPVINILPDTPHQGIVINLPELMLYYYGADGSTVHIYPVGIGRSGWTTPEVETYISEIRHQPTWHPPASIRAESAREGKQLPKSVPPGPQNPLGEIALRIGSSDYLIHGTNNPDGVGMRVSHGCIRMFPEDIAELTALLDHNTPVRIVNQPIKWGMGKNGGMLQAHRPLAEENTVMRKRLAQGFDRLEQHAGHEARINAEQFAARLLNESKLFTGIPQLIPVPAATPETTDPTL